MIAHSDQRLRDFVAGFQRFDSWRHQAVQEMRELRQAGADCGALAIEIETTLDMLREAAGLPERHA